MYKILHQSENSKGNKHYNAFTYGNKSYSTHFHKSPELLYVLKGHLELKVNDRETVLTEGEWGIVLSKQLHSFRAGRDCLVWVAVFSEDFVPEFASFVKNKQGKTSGFFADEEIGSFVFKHLILEEPNILMKRACLGIICDQYLRRVELEERSQKDNDLLCNVLEYIEENYRENITLCSVAQVFGYEYHYLSRLLGQSYHVRFKNILNGCRVEHAILLLETGEISMTEIAMQCGFQSIRSFNDVFLATTGFSPTQYQKINFQK